MIDRILREGLRFTVGLCAILLLFTLLTNPSAALVAFVAIAVVRLFAHYVI